MGYRRKLCFDAPGKNTRMVVSVIPGENGTGFNLHRTGLRKDWRKNMQTSPVPDFDGLPLFATEEEAIREAELIVQDYIKNRELRECPDEPDDQFPSL